MVLSHPTTSREAHFLRHSGKVAQNTKESRAPNPYLGLDDLLREATHGIDEPALQALGEVPDGLCEGAWRCEPEAHSERGERTSSPPWGLPDTV